MVNIKINILRCTVSEIYKKYIILGGKNSYFFSTHRSHQRLSQDASSLCCFAEAQAYCWSSPHKFSLPFCLISVSLTLTNTLKTETILYVETRSANQHSCQTQTDAIRDVLEAVQLVTLKIKGVSKSTLLSVFIERWTSSNQLWWGHWPLNTDHLKVL